MEAVILAGGLGTRLKGSVPDKPKCLAPVADEPFLGFLFRYLEARGFDHVVLSLGFRSEDVIAWLYANNEWRFSVDYVVEKEPLGTGGAINFALERCLEDRVFVFNGDTLFNIDCRKLLASEAPAVLALKPMENFDRYGVVRLENGLVSGFEEKKPQESGLINGGVYLINRNLFRARGLSSGLFSFEKEVLEPLSALSEVAGIVFDSYFIDIGVPVDYNRAQKELPLLETMSRVDSAVLASGADYLLLDRDGVINVHLPGDYVKSPDEFVFIPGFKESLAGWSKRFRRIAVVSNQRGVGRGVMSESDLSSVHRKMLSEIERSGGRIDGIFVCTSVSDSDPFRKPNTGLFEEVKARFPELDPARTVMVGDSPTDEEFARRCKINFIAFR